MKTRWIGMIALSAAWQLSAVKTAAAQSGEFGLTTIHDYRIALPAAEWETMQKVVGGGPSILRFFSAPKPADKPTDVHKGGGFGTEFPFARAEFSEGDSTVKNVGLRYKGNASYMASAGGLKRNLKVEFDHYDDALRFRGMKTVNLNAGAMDATKVHEALAYSLFRAAGVPAPRTAFARVRLTVPGKYDDELLGLYTVVEQVDKAFLKDRFKNGKGLLMKPERLRGLEYLGDDWDKYKATYQPKHDATPDQAKRVIDFARLVFKADDATFAKEIASYLDIEEFLRYLAVNSFVVNQDCFYTMGHNYYIYLNPETNKFAYLPWDLDLSFGAMGGGGGQQINLSLTHPHPGENKLIDRVMGVKSIAERYRAILKDLNATVFKKDRLLAELESIEKAIADSMAQEKKAVEARKETGRGGRGPGGFGGGPGGPGGGGGRSMKEFIVQRTAAVDEQVAGKTTGYIPTRGFGPGGGGPGGGRPGSGVPGGGGPGGMRMPQPGEIVPATVQERLQLTAEQKKALADLQKETDAQLDKLLTEAQRKQLKELRGRVNGGPGGG